jgi:ABC-type Fe3+-hydroxamate transport system substrate-binding protein
MRIVSLVPSLTETLFDLGVGPRVVGVTRYCSEPEAALRAVPRVGGTKNPDLDQVAALRPDLVLVNGEENRDEHIAWLKQRFRVHESLPTTVLEAAHVVREIAGVVDAVDAGEAIGLEIEAQVARAEVESLTRRPVRVFYAIWKKPWMAINATTYIHDVLTRAGAINVTAEGDSRYPVLSPQELKPLSAELVLLPSEPFVFQEAHRRELLDERLFGPEVPVALVDGKDFSWHGSHSGRGLGRALEALRPYRGVAGAGLGRGGR